MSVINETKHLAQGSAYPPLTPGRLRLYSMKFCPFAQRTRLVLAHKNIPHEVVNVSLRATEKPDWFLERNPLGLVPVLERDDQVVYESIICDDYLEDIFPQNPLRSEDPYIRARHNIIAAGLGKFIGHFYKMPKAKPEEKEQMNEEMDRCLEPYENILNTPFLSGDEVGMLDYHMWPWVERLVAYKPLTGYEISQEKFPKLNQWIARMFETPGVKATALPPRALIEFGRAYAKGTWLMDEIEI